MLDRRLDLLSKGDITAFTSLFDEYLPRLYSFCLKYLHNKDDAEEVVQDTFVKVWETHERIDPSKIFGTYLISIAKYRIYNIIKHKLVEDKHQDKISASLYSNITEEDKLLKDDILQLMITSIEDLPPRQREILLLRSQGYSNPEIAVRLGISLRSVETYYSKGLLRLRSVLGSEHNLAILLFLSPFL